LWRTLLVVAAALVLATGGLAWRVWRALPTTSGRLQLAGIASPVEILRDRYGIPHIRAGNELDAYFGLGFVHAQDRLWQMEFQRRIARGRLSEVLGPAALPTDRWFRTLGFGRLVTEHWARLTPEARAIAEAYVRGVNAVVAAHHGTRAPVEFAILGVDPEPWTGQDVLLWVKVMSLGLDTNYRDELLRARLVPRVGADGAAALMPEYTARGPVILPEGIAPSNPPDAAPEPPSAGQPISPRGSRAERRRIDRHRFTMSGARREAVRAAAAVAAQPPAPRVGWFPDGGGSNSWVVSGARSATGRPLLANDPHLGAGLPSVWYLAHFEGGAVNVIGATLPGTPAVPIGHNQRIAWGATNLMADVQDLFVERLNASQAAEFRGAWEPLRLRHETIRVKGHPDEPLVVRLTRHGPLVSDVLPNTGEAVALRWTALDSDDPLLESYRRVSLAGDWEQFTIAVAPLKSPVLNFVYADVHGNIGYFAPGALPSRPGGGDGTLPVPGWTGDHEWAGYVPPEQLPRIYNPTRGFIVTANNRAMPDGYAHRISTSWEPGYRAERITELIEASGQATVDSFARMQRDVRTPEVQMLLPWLQRARLTDDRQRAAVDRLRRWDGAMSAESSEAAIYAAWVSTATERLFADELGVDLWTDWAQWPQWRAKALDRLVAQSDERWCDDVRTVRPEGCDEQLGEALRLALDGLAARHRATDPAEWAWRDDNAIVFPHAPFEGHRWLRPLFSRRIGAGGSATTVNPVMHLPTRPVIASYRQIIDLGNFDNSRFVHPLGQSGQLWSSHYTDLLEPWRNVEYVPMAYTRAAVDRVVVERLVLDPVR
jgi:penicillin amidase